MQTCVIGAGPAGLLMSAALAERGHHVTVVDRDSGPAAHGTWPRKGVMQFHHAHAFRPQVLDVLRAELPAALDAWVEAGGEPVSMTPPAADVVVTGMRSRRSTFEQALRATALSHPRVTFHRGHVDEVTSSGGRVSGIQVDGRHHDADLVIDASGRSSRVTRDLRAEAVSGGACGIAYVDRLYQLHDGAEPGPMLNPIAWQGDYDGYQVIIFLHERGIFSVLIIRPTDDKGLVGLRHDAAFEAACRAIPALADWTDPARSRPLTRVLPGGPMLNWFRSQRGPDGDLALPGLLFVGDSVCTTTPNFGRGIATTFLQARELLRLIDAHPTDHAAVGEAFDVWTHAEMKPWVDDHVHMDEAQRRRWCGEDVDLGSRLPSDLVLAAGDVDPVIAAALPPYISMAAGPAALDAVEPLARAIFARGWRPEFAPGPGRDELAEIVAAAGS